MKQMVTDLKFALVIAVLLGTCALFIARYYEARRTLTFEEVEASIHREMTFEEACHVLHRTDRFEDLPIDAERRNVRMLAYYCVSTQDRPFGGRYNFLFRPNGTLWAWDYDSGTSVY